MGLKGLICLFRLALARTDCKLYISIVKWDKYLWDFLFSYKHIIYKSNTTKIDSVMGSGMVNQGLLAIS